MAVLITHGMSAWVAVVTALAPPRPAPAPAGTMSGPPMDVAPALRSELTQLLASLVLACARQEVLV